MKNMEAEFLQAVEAHRNGDMAAAEPVYRRMLELNPNHPEARHMIGVVELQSGRPAEAEGEVRRAISLNHGIAKYHNTLGNILVALSQPDEALAAFAAALKCDGGFSKATYNIGTVLLSLDCPADAEAAFNSLLDQGTGNAALINNLCTALINQNKISEALELSRQGLLRFPDHPALLTNLATALELSNDLAGAEEAARKAYENSPDFAMAGLIMGRVLRRLERFSEALKIITMVLDSQLGSSERAEALHEKGLVLDELGSFGDAFVAISSGNMLRAGSLDAERCDGDHFLDDVRDLRLWAENRQPQQPATDCGDTPVFFVGFPRSGTTLMEQALAAHPDIVTSEENSPLNAVETLTRQLAKAAGSGYPQYIDAMNNDQLRELRRIFWDRAKATCQWFPGYTLVDKLPLNIVQVGLIERLWPRARLIVAHRDPRDVCLSCFIQKFKLNNAMVNFLDLERTAITYAQVMGLWLCQRDNLSLPVFEYRYEDLVDDFENTVRRVLDFIGVGWHDDVSRYRERAARNLIKTPSYRQVTGRVHSRAVNRWKSYENELAPILDTLSPFVDAFGYDGPINNRV